MNNLILEAPTLTDLAQTFDGIKNLKQNGVPGVLRFDSGKPGPILGITIQTHGDEPSGLAPLWYFLNVSPIGNLLQNGTIFFVINNLRAANESAPMTLGVGKRCIHTDFNRLPEDVMSLVDRTSYEVCRAQELRTVWESFDVGLDIHSVSQKDTIPMIVAVRKFEMELVKGFPIDTVITNIENVQKGRPATMFYGGERNIPVLGIEAGYHMDPLSFKVAIACTLSLLKNLGMINADAEIAEKREYRLYKVVNSLFFPSDEWSLDHVFTGFDSISKGDIMASDKNGNSIYAPVSGCTIMAPKKLKPKSIANEVLFYTEPVKKLVI